MYAIIRTGGKQYRVSQGQDIKVEKLKADVGDSVIFDHVLLAGEGENIRIGNPYLENSRVIGRLRRHGKNSKVVVFKFIRRKNFRRTRGHRQEYSLVTIENIEA
jgi:large subunit ribosomal protein L21